jgi:hypothetical protein
LDERLTTLFYKKIIVGKSKEFRIIYPGIDKYGRNLYGSRQAVLPMMMLEL